MGLLTKKQVEAAKKAKREAKSDKKRNENTRSGFVSILIVCEGEKTEPNYFEALKKDRYSKILDVKVEGEGRNTVSLIKKTIKIRDSSVKLYDRVWAVFDKDSFKDFNKAIKLAEDNDILCAWSNESFEFWYCLHFRHLDSGVSRYQYIDMLEREIKNKTKNKKYKYKKNDPNTYFLLKEYGNEANAIMYAKKIEESYPNKNYSKHNPSTMVYKLVEELNNPEELLDIINNSKDI